MKTVAGWNMPGYLPEMDPQLFDTPADAVAFIIDELNRTADDYAGEDTKLVEECDELINELEQTTEEEWSVLLEGGDSIPSGLFYWWQYVDDEDEVKELEAMME